MKSEGALNGSPASFADLTGGQTAHEPGGDQGGGVTVAAVPTAGAADASDRCLRQSGARHHLDDLILLAHRLTVGTDGELGGQLVTTVTARGQWMRNGRNHDGYLAPPPQGR
jgi:hypothetical protein